MKAIRFSGQMHGAVMLDRREKPVRPAILHNDGRAYAEAAELARDFPHLAGIVGVKPMPGFTGPKLLWVGRHEPEIRGRIDCVLAPKDYLRLALCGERGADMSDAAGSWMLDEAARTWSTDAIAACGADPAWAPRLSKDRPHGTILPSVAEVSVCRTAQSSPRVAATRRPGRWGSAPLRRARLSFRSAPQRSSSSRPTAISARPTAGAQLRPCAARTLVCDGSHAERGRRARLRRTAPRATPDRQAAEGYRGPGDLVLPARSLRGTTPLDTPTRAACCSA